jgi:hypothetical protein
MPVPDFSPGEVLTAAAMDSIGLWKIAETSFGPTAISAELDDVFTNDFQTYEIHWIIMPTTSVNLFCQFRSGGVNDATAAYQTQKTSFAATTVATNRLTNQTSFSPADINNTSNSNTGKLTIFRPKEAQRTSFLGNANASVGGTVNWQCSGQFSGATQFDGFRFHTSSGTFSGSMKVYGYRD